MEKIVRYNVETLVSQDGWFIDLGDRVEHVVSFDQIFTYVWNFAIIAKPKEISDVMKLFHGGSKVHYFAPVQGHSGLSASVFSSTPKEEDEDDLRFNGSLIDYVRFSIPGVSIQKDITLTERDCDWKAYVERIIKE